jgi:hypothetical protein
MRIEAPGKSLPFNGVDSVISESIADIPRKAKLLPTMMLPFFFRCFHTPGVCRQPDVDDARVWRLMRPRMPEVFVPSCTMNCDVSS